MLKGGFAEFYELYGEQALLEGFIEVDRADLNRSCRGYTKMRERPNEQYWTDLQTQRCAQGLDHETLERQRE